MDVLIVAHQLDDVALRLRHVLEKEGRLVSHLDGPDASRIFTIRGGPGRTAVTPTIPVFVRSSAWWHEEVAGDLDQRFLRDEAYAAFWAAAALSPAPVINRPGREGDSGRLTCGTLIAMDTDARSITGSLGEFHVSGREALGSAGETSWGEDPLFRVAPVAQFPVGLPLRARVVDAAALTEIVTVVGDRGFPMTTDPRTEELRLRPRSVAIARRAGVHFATITWSIGESGAIPARLNPMPGEHEFGYQVDEVLSALREDLLR